MRWLSSVCIIAIATAHALGQSFPASATPAELIRNLSVDDWRQRQAAQDALVQLGDDAVPLLSATTQSSSDEETRSRATAALAKIAEDRLTGPSHITLHLHDVLPKAAFAQLANQARASLEPITPVFWQSVGNSPISVDLDRVPFWEAMRVLSEKTGVYLQEWGTGLRLTNGPLFPGPQSISGSFLVIADQMERNQSVKFGPNAEHEDRLSLSLMFMAEPKIRVVRASQNVELSEALDENGNSMIPAETPEGDNAIVAIGESARWNCNAALNFPKQNAGTRLKLLRGSIRASLASRIEQLDFPKLKTPATLATSDGLTVLVSQISPVNSGNQTEVHILATLPAGRGNNSDLADQLSRPTCVGLFDASNRPIARESVQVNGDEKGVNVVIRFSALNGEDGTRVGPPDHLSVKVMTATKEVTVPFEFKDLPLP